MVVTEPLTTKIQSIKKKNMRIIAAIHRIKDKLKKDNTNNPNSELFRFLKTNVDDIKDDENDQEREVWYDANEDPNDPIQEADNVPEYCKGEGMMMVIQKYHYCMSCKSY